ncbi:hypothetical protein GOHSU_18_01500 [Gordonia hirsuta DSM 44140 = NBRC 16056]|uniref:DUF3000 domain-containing protein n=1 Tax=Gordonia hirsuta DSM 44140 = NBRC 16056 TaxID=1121927 RepID=L7L8C0_9ACTN|nr:DUF3000 domain-containing protein [Gordonia hirsuta]GAC57395.1 hypothetical protein GOHSU_18_01500 [Gordonia hirsuta DSM 44140 = NBRC 16056]
MEPTDFTEAVASLHTAVVRPEIEVGSIRPPQRLAPYSYALGVEVTPPDINDPTMVPADSAGSAFGRLVLLYDPAGHEAWNGTFRLVAFVQAEVEADLAEDPLLPEVAWEWLSEALGVPKGSTESLPTLGSDVPAVLALGGTVTATTSVRYGDIAGPPRAHQLELRASWTSSSSSLAGHLEAFCEVLASAAGLPPAGVASLHRLTSQ